VYRLPNKLLQLVRRIMDLTADGVYLMIWLAVNLLLHRGFGLFHPPDLIFFFYLVSQGIFAVSTLAVIVLHGVKDLTAEPEGGITGTLTKIRDMGSNLLDLVLVSILLVVWAVVNWLVDEGFAYFQDKSIITFLLHKATQIAFAMYVLSRIVKDIYHDIRIIYRDLFPK
jgi:hypothetical protein